MLKQTEGSRAVAEAVALCRPDVICAYPISPQTHIVEGLGELVKVAKDSPGKLNFGSAGLGTTPHIGSELFKQEAQIDVIHVAYKGTAPATTPTSAPPSTHG